MNQIIEVAERLFDDERELVSALRAGVAVALTLPGSAARIRGIAEVVAVTPRDLEKLHTLADLAEGM